MEMLSLVIQPQVPVQRSVRRCTGCDSSAKRTVIGSLITIKPTDSDTLILEPYYGNEANASVIVIPERPLERVPRLLHS